MNVNVLVVKHTELDVLYIHSGKKVGGSLR